MSYALRQVPARLRVPTGPTRSASFSVPSMEGCIGSGKPCRWGSAGSRASFAHRPPRARRSVSPSRRARSSVPPTEVTPGSSNGCRRAQRLMRFPAPRSACARPSGIAALCAPPMVAPRGCYKRCRESRTPFRVSPVRDLTKCEAFGWTSGFNPAGVVIGTSNGGGTWRSQHIPTKQSPAAISCASSTTCEIALSAPFFGGPATGQALRTTDGGLTWERQSIVDGVVAKRHFLPSAEHMRGRRRHAFFLRRSPHH